MGGGVPGAAACREGHASAGGTQAAWIYDDEETNVRTIDGDVR